MASRTVECRLFFLVLLNFVFWAVYNILQTEYILFQESVEHEQISVNNQHNIDELQHKILKLKQFHDESLYQFVSNAKSKLSTKTSIVFIADIAGFIGYHTALKLISMNIKVVGFETLDPCDDISDISNKFERIKQLKQSQFNHNILDIIYGNSTDHKHLTHIFTQFTITHILYLIPCNYYGSKLSISHFHICTHSLMTFLDSIIDSYPDRHKDITFIYGYHQSNLNTNSFILNINCNIAKLYHVSYDLHITLLRFYSVYGPFHYTFIDQMRNKTHPNTFDLIYISDAVNAIISALNYGYKYAVFDLAKGKSASIQQVLNYINGNASNIDDTNIKMQHNIHNVNISLAKQYLQHTASVELHQGMKHLLKWYNNVFYPRVQYINNKKRYLILNCFMKPNKVPELTNYWNKYKQSKKLRNITAVDEYYSSLQDAVMNKNDLKYLIDIVIFHNGVTWKEQIANPQYNDIMFISIEFDYKYHHFRAYNDARFIWWYYYLNKHKHYYRYVLITDLFDVQFGRDPFQYISKKIANDENAVISGTQNKATQMHDYKDYILKVMRRCYYGASVWNGRQMYEQENLYNPGSGIAAYADIVWMILRRMVLYEMPYADPMCDANMMQYMKTMIYMIKNQSLHVLNTTKDWNSPFEKHENHTDKKYVIYHK